MGLKADLESDVNSVYGVSWTRRNGQVVPSDTDIKLGNDGVDLTAAILYADLSDSTKMVDKYKDWFSADNYKTFLICASKIIKSEGGEIRSFDGDRVMGIFIGDSKCTAAVRCALKINWAVKKIIQPKINSTYKDCSYVMKHVVGVDISDVLAARAGIRGSNDLVWIGKAPNYAAKLTGLSDDTPTWITHRVYDLMNESVKLSNGNNMWVEKIWTPMNKLKIYCSTYFWEIS